MRLVDADGMNTANEAKHVANLKSITFAIHNFENFSDERVSAEECFKKARSSGHRLQPNDDDPRNAASRRSIATINSKLDAIDNDTAQLDDNMNALSTMAFTLSDPEFGGRRPRTQTFGLLKEFQGVDAGRLGNLFAPAALEDAMGDD